jgi:hypothetical protein
MCGVIALLLSGAASATTTAKKIVYPLECGEDVSNTSVTASTTYDAWGGSADAAEARAAAWAEDQCGDSDYVAAQIMRIPNLCCTSDDADDPRECEPATEACKPTVGAAVHVGGGEYEVKDVSFIPADVYCDSDGGDKAKKANQCDDCGYETEEGKGVVLQCWVCPLAKNAGGYLRDNATGLDDTQTFFGTEEEAEEYCEDVAEELSLEVRWDDVYPCPERPTLTGGVTGTDLEELLKIRAEEEKEQEEERRKRYEDASFESEPTDEPIFYEEDALIGFEEEAFDDEWVEADVLEDEVFDGDVWLEEPTEDVAFWVDWF